MNLKETVKELCSVSNLYGIPNLVRSKRFDQKILWITFIIGSTIASYFLIKIALFEYLEYKVVTVTESIYEQPTEFPTVSICGYRSTDFTNKTPKDFIKDCYFGYDYACNKSPNNFFEKFTSGEYGQCFRFNSGKNLTNHSVTILESIIGGIDDSLSIRFDKIVDIAVWIHHRLSPPNLDHRNSHANSRIFVPSNCYTEIKVDKVIEVKLGEPYNECLEDVTKFKLNKTLINFIISNNQKYSQEKCLELCFDLDYIETNPCECGQVNLGDVWNKCWYYYEKKTRNSCTWKYKVNFYSKSILEKCSKYCPLECTSLSYDIRSSTMLNMNITRVKIYLSSLKYTMISQEPKTQIIDLISNIGGTFGLLIGFSFVTFFEIFELLIEIFIKTFEIRKKIKQPNYIKNNTKL